VMEKAGNKGNPAGQRGESHETRQQNNLINHDAAVKDDRHGNHGLGEAIFAVKAQQEQTKADDGKFPNDEMIPEHRDGPTGNRIELRAPTVQNHVSERGVENVQHDNSEQHREESMTVTVDITTAKPILPSTEAAPPTAEERIAAQHGCGLFAAIGMISFIHIGNPKCLLCALG